MQLSTDGELTITTPVTIECLPGALRVLVPPELEALTRRARTAR